LEISDKYKEILLKLFIEQKDHIYDLIKGANSFKEYDEVGDMKPFKKLDFIKEILKQLIPPRK